MEWYLIAFLVAVIVIQRFKIAQLRVKVIETEQREKDRINEFISNRKQKHQWNNTSSWTKAIRLF